MRFTLLALLLACAIASATPQGPIEKHPCTLILGPQPKGWDENWAKIECRRVNIGRAVIRNEEIVKIKDHYEWVKEQRWPYVVYDPDNCPYKTSTGVMVFRQPCKP